MSVPPDSMPRRVPPPCWTQEETLVLIEAYRDKWYSVNRGSLRAADWKAIAASLAESSTIDPPKSSVQCRHKIEKLRKRYRMEKQRCLNYPGRFFSSWDLFPLLDSMDIGSVGSKQHEDIDEGDDKGDEFRMKNLGGRHLVAPKEYSNANRDWIPDFDLDPALAFRSRKYYKIKGDSSVSFGFDHDLNTGSCLEPSGDKNSVSVAFVPKDYARAHNLGTGFSMEPIGDKNSVAVPFRPKEYGRADGKFAANVDFDCDYGGGFGMKMQKTEGDRNLMSQGVRLKGFGKLSDDSIPNNGIGRDGVDIHAGFPVKALGNRNLVPPGFKPKKYRKINEKPTDNFCGGFDDVNCQMDRSDRVWKKEVDEWSSAPPGFVPKNYCEINGSSKHDVNSRDFNGYGKVNTNGIGSGDKMGMDPVGEVVLSIKLFTEGFVKVEKMKMDMAMEIERMRMDMELKHNQMILESQKQIANTFAKVILQKRKEVEIWSPNSERNGDSHVAGTDCESIRKNSIVKEEHEGVVT